jgi:Rab-like protein 5
MNSDLKIVFVGPPQSGKTVLADLISAASKTFQENTKPTVCLRILEFAAAIEVGGLQTTISAQIWDTSGSDAYSQVWPAIAYQADAVVVIYNAYDKAQGRLAESYAKRFIKGLDPTVVLFVAHKIGHSDDKPLRPKLQKPLDTAQITIVDAREPLDEFFGTFNRFLERVQQAKVQRIEAGERALIGEARPKADEDDEAE